VLNDLGFERTEDWCKIEIDKYLSGWKATIQLRKNENIK